MKILLKVIFLAISSKCCMCTISGLSYLDPLRQRQLMGTGTDANRDDPCNPLYWYPRSVPDSCNGKNTNNLPPNNGNNGNGQLTPGPIPVPIPVPQAPPPYPPFPYPPYPSYPMPMPMPMPPQQMGFVPSTIPAMPVPLPPLPYGIPIAPTAPMIPVGGLPYPYIPPPMGYPQVGQAGLVPGIPGLVTPDGGINIMPFSDAYSDMLEQYKQKMIRRKMEKLIEKYDKEPWSKKYRKSRDYGRRLNYYDRRR